MLKIGGYINILIGIGHLVGLIWPEQMFEKTGALEGMKTLAQIHFSLPYLLTVFVALIFLIFGLYGLSAGEKIKKLPFLKFGIYAIASIYLFRGIAEQLYNISQQTTTISETIQSIIAVIIGLLFLIGGLKKWKFKNRIK
ncbi:Ca2+/Na+ antiporter [Aquimarina sp. EL_43]|uniref:hypothetical protein n=1 Tax=unclassified Aquimarina TaxID=2627091 RepID=UPI0018C9AE5A|nr:MULTISPECIES: hypothetical protein [unclassified Aquimarina]MBG6131548.1 Ca2+/Na+ antiporter [Aquimarina sp. EL_35]MBG6152008.1 Ca2+/Na+ antiporter [Aquimarina sp. EL_32]MBG6170048.1 Ca2+/Na+ antiporter [Aquimarina sp. EL_43]